MDFTAAEEGKQNYISVKDILLYFNSLYNNELIDDKSFKFMMDILERQQVKGRLDNWKILKLVYNLYLQNIKEI